MRTPVPGRAPMGGVAGGGAAGTAPPAAQNKTGAGALPPGVPMIAPGGPGTKTQPGAAAPQPTQSPLRAVNPERTPGTLVGPGGPGPASEATTGPQVYPRQPNAERNPNTLVGPGTDAGETALPKPPGVGGPGQQGPGGFPSAIQSLLERLLSQDPNAVDLPAEYRGLLETLKTPVDQAYPGMTDADRAARRVREEETLNTKLAGELGNLSAASGGLDSTQAASAAAGLVGGAQATLGGELAGLDQAEKFRSQDLENTRRGQLQQALGLIASMDGAGNNQAASVLSALLNYDLGLSGQQLQRYGIDVGADTQRYGIDVNRYIAEGNQQTQMSIAQLNDETQRIIAYGQQMLGEGRLELDRYLGEQGFDLARYQADLEASLTRAGYNSQEAIAQIQANAQRDIAQMNAESQQYASDADLRLEQYANPVEDSFTSWWNRNHVIPISGPTPWRPSGAPGAASTMPTVRSYA